MFTITRKYDKINRELFLNGAKNAKYQKAYQ